MSRGLFNGYMGAVLKVEQKGMGRRGESGDYLLYADDLVLYGKSKEDLRAIC